MASNLEKKMNKEISLSKTGTAKAPRLVGPYEFRDNTDYRSGWSMGTQAEVLAFFRRNSYLRNQEEWGNAYQCGLTDANGVECWVERGRVVTCEEEEF